MLWLTRHGAATGTHRKAAPHRSRYRDLMVTLPFSAFDADNHYSETTDAFTRHLDPKIGPRAGPSSGQQRQGVAP